MKKETVILLIVVSAATAGIVGFACGSLLTHPDNIKTDITDKSLAEKIILNSYIAKFYTLQNLRGSATEAFLNSRNQSDLSSNMRIIYNQLRLLHKKTCEHSFLNSSLQKQWEALWTAIVDELMVEKQMLHQNEYTLDDMKTAAQKSKESSTILSLNRICIFDSNTWEKIVDVSNSDDPSWENF